jgi:hypothetical protein
MPSLQKHIYLSTVQEVIFHLPLQFELPAILFTLNENDCANVLQSASKIIEFQKQTAFDAQRDHFVHEKVSKEIQEKEQEVTQMKKQLEKLRHSKDEEISQHLLEIEKLRTRLETVHYTVTEQTEKRVEDIRLSKDNHIHDLKESIAKLQLEKQSLESKLQEKTLAAGKSQKKGTQGELFFQEAAKEAIDWNLTIISKSEHTTDLQLETRGVHAFFEVKNYDKPPPHEQYKKFLNDMNLHTETDIGFYISLKSEIPYYDNLTIEWTPSHQMLVIVPRFLQYDMHRIFHEFELYIQIVKKIRSLFSKLETNEDDTKKLERVTTYVQNMMKRLDRAKKDYDIYRKQLQASVDTMKQHVEGFFDAQLKDISSTLAILGDTEEESVSVTHTETVESLPNLAPEKKRRKPKTTKKETD